MWTHASHYIPQTTAAWESSPRLPTWQTAVSREYPVSKPQHAGKPSSLESSWTSPSCWPSACVFDSAYRPQIQCIWEIHAGCFWGPSMENISVELSEPSVWPLSHMTPSCLPGLTTLFLIVPLWFSQASSSPSYHNSMPCLLRMSCSHPPGSTPFSLSPTPHRNAFFFPLILIWSSLQGSVQSCLLNKTFWTLGLS